MSVHNLDPGLPHDQLKQDEEKKPRRQASVVQTPAISALAAKKKVHLYLGLHWGQNFSVDDPVLQEPDGTMWVVPVWYATPHEGRREKMLDVVVDARTGEFVEEENLRQTLEQFGG